MQIALSAALTGVLIQVGPFRAAIQIPWLKDEMGRRLSHRLNNELVCTEYCTRASTGEPTLNTGTSQVILPASSVEGPPPLRSSEPKAN